MTVFLSLNSVILPQLSVFVLKLIILILNDTPDIIGKPFYIIHLLIIVIIVKLNALPLRLVLHDLRIILPTHIYLTILLYNSLLQICLHVDLISPIQCLRCALNRLSSLA